jgi:hypothetical protein
MKTYIYRDFVLFIVCPILLALALRILVMAWEEPVHPKQPPRQQQQQSEEAR